MAAANSNAFWNSSRKGGGSARLRAASKDKDLLLRPAQGDVASRRLAATKSATPWQSHARVRFEGRLKTP